MPLLCKALDMLSPPDLLVSLVPGAQHGQVCGRCWVHRSIQVLFSPLPSSSTTTDALGLCTCLQSTLTFIISEDAFRLKCPRAV